MSPKRSGVVLWTLAAACIALGVITNLDWYRASFGGNLWAPSFWSVFWDFDGPYDDNIHFAGAFNAVGLGIGWAWRSVILGLQRVVVNP